MLGQRRVYLVGREPLAGFGMIQPLGTTTSMRTVAPASAAAKAASRAPGSSAGSAMGPKALRHIAARQCAQVNLRVADRHADIAVCHRPAALLGHALLVLDVVVERSGCC